MCWLLHVGVRVTRYRRLTSFGRPWGVLHLIPCTSPLKQLLALFNQPQVGSKKFVIQQPFPMINPSFPMKIDQTRKFSALVIVPYPKITPRSCKNNLIQSPLSWLCKKKWILPWTQNTLVLIGKGLDIHLFLRLIPSQLPTFQPICEKPYLHWRRALGCHEGLSNPNSEIPKWQKLHVRNVRNVSLICSNMYTLNIYQSKNYIYVVCVFRNYWNLSIQHIVGAADL